MSEVPRVATRMCAECARDFTHEPAGVGGRPPSRCPSCRASSSNGNGKAHASTAVAVKPKPRVVTEPPAVAAPRAPLDIPALQAQLASEIEQLEAAIALRVRVQRALEAYDASLGIAR